MVLICISLMISDAEHIFIYLLAICMSSLENYLLQHSAPYKIGFFSFLPLSCMSSIFILDINLLSDICAVLCLVAPSYATLCDPMDCSPPGSSLHGDSPGKNTGVGAISFSRGPSPWLTLRHLKICMLGFSVSYAQPRPTWETLTNLGD